MNLKSQNKKSRRPIVERLGEKLDIPADVISGVYLELRGRNNLTVKGCRKILLYTPGEVRLLLSGQTLRVIGAELYCTAYHGRAVEIDGRIDMLSFLKGEETVGE